MPNRSRYQRVTRVITICIGQTGNKCAIDVCPEHAEAIIGDKVVWQVQNAPSGVKVTVGNLRRVDPPPDIFLRQGRAPLLRARALQPSGPAGMAHTTSKADVGYYKYDIVFDGHAVLDPDLEIRGPKV
jgi:hypothetical protein